jgi:hypothetical protein
MSFLLVFNRVYRLEIQSVMTVFSTPLVNCCPFTFSLTLVKTTFRDWCLYSYFVHAYMSWFTWPLTMTMTIVPRCKLGRAVHTTCLGRSFLAGNFSQSVLLLELKKLWPLKILPDGPCHYCRGAGRGILYTLIYTGNTVWGPPNITQKWFILTSTLMRFMVRTHDVNGPHHPSDALSKGRIVQGTHCPRDAIFSLFVSGHT